MYVEILRYFQQFDVIEFINWHQMNDAQYGFVQFKTTKGAQTALQHSEYRFGTVVLNVVAAKPWHQPDCPSKFKQMLNNTDNIRITQNNCNFPIRTLYVTSNQPIVSVTIENKKKICFSIWFNFHCLILGNSANSQSL